MNPQPPKCPKWENQGADRICISEECKSTNPFICPDCEEAHEHNGMILAVRINKIHDIQNKAVKKKQFINTLIDSIVDLKNYVDKTVTGWMAELAEESNLVMGVQAKLTAFWQHRSNFREIWNNIKQNSKQIEEKAHLEAQKERIDNLNIQIRHLFEGGEEEQKNIGEGEPKTSSKFWGQFSDLLSFLPMKLTSQPKTESLQKIKSLKAENRDEIKCLTKIYELCEKDEEAIELLTQALAQNSLDSEMINRRAILLKKNKRWQEAFDDYSMMISLLQGKMSLELYYFQRAQISKEMEKYELALHDYKKCQQKTTSYNYEISKAIGYCLQKQQKHTEAIQNYQRCLAQLKPEQKGKLVEIYQLLIECVSKNTKDLEKTLNLLASLDGIAPGNPSIWLQKASLDHHLGKYQQAYEEYTKALQKIKDNANIYYNRAIESIYLKRPKQAIDDLQKSLQIDPKFREAANLMSSTAFEQTEDPLMKSEFLPIAIQAHIFCTKLFPNGEGIWHNLGLLYTETQPKKAYDSFCKAIQINPNLVASYLGRVKVSFPVKIPAEQILLDVQKIIDLGNATAHILYIRAILEEELSQFEAALLTMDKVLEKDSDRVDAIEGKLRLSLKLNRKEDIEPLIEKLGKFSSEKAAQYRQMM